MKNILICWIGLTDIRAAEGKKQAGRGPIAQALELKTFDEVWLINDLPEKDSALYLQWLKKQTEVPIVARREQLTNPTNFTEIYEAAVRCIENVQAQHGRDVSLTYHISPGTSHMAAVWVILAKTRFPAELIDSSPQEGVKTVSFPFEVSAEFMPDLLKPSDRRLAELSEGLPPEAPEFAQILHKSAVMKRLIAKARHVAPRSVPVLIEGESGTGKELLARAIHHASPRKGKFVAINCGAIPSELVEAELFGHVKGAFTGAEKERKGVFEAADGGTLFLDELGDLPTSVQVKLLRALQENEIARVGSTETVKVDVRIIAATHRDLIAETAAGRFRTDLFYRLAVAVLKIPPLRERKGDISFLIDRLLDQVNLESANEPGYKDKKISPDAKNLLLQHQWPGNVRELLNTLRRAAIWTSGRTITRLDTEDALIPLASTGSSNVLNRPLGDGFNLNKTLSGVARHYIDRALQESGGSKKKAAELIGFSNYQTLSNWMKKHGVE